MTSSRGVPSSGAAFALVRPLAVPALLLAAVALLAGCENRQLDRLREGASGDRAEAADGLESHSLPSLALPDLTGDTLHLVDQLGPRATLVNFWATWCVPCRQEMPALVEIHQRYRDRGVQVVGVAVASPDTGQIRSWIQEYGIGFPIIRGMSGRELVEYIGWDGIPTTLVVDGSGTVRHVMFGARTHEELNTALEPLLDR